MLRRSNKSLFHNPEKVHFKNKEELDAYQHAQLEKILSFYRVENLSSSLHGLPAKFNRTNSISLKTSGTTAVPKYYSYSAKEYYLIESYHTKRIMFFNGMSPGNVVLVRPNAPKTPIIGEPYHLPLFPDSEVYDLNYDISLASNPQFWINAIKQVETLNPSFIYLRPCEIQLISASFPKRDYPAISTCETLYQNVRNKGEVLFDRVIDKMRCWDGGLSFFECKYGRKHINDELCLVEEDADHNLYSTDFYNLSMPFIRYATGDVGKLDIGTCKCGIYGNYFTQFNGKKLESIVTQNGLKIPGTVIMNALMFHCKDEFAFPLSIKQDKDKNILVEAGKELKDSLRNSITLYFKQMINVTGYPDCKVAISENLKLNTGSKQLLITSDAFKEI